MDFKFFGKHVILPFIKDETKFDTNEGGVFVKHEEINLG